MLSLPLVQVSKHLSYLDLKLTVRSIIKGTQLIKTVPGLTEELLKCVPCRNGKHQVFIERVIDHLPLIDRWPGCQPCGRPRRSEYFYRPHVQGFVTKFYTVVPQGLSAEAQVQRDEFCSRHKASIQDMVKVSSFIPSSTALPANFPTARKRG